MVHGCRKAGPTFPVLQKSGTHPWVRLRSSAAQATSWGEQVRALQDPNLVQQCRCGLRGSHVRWHPGQQRHPQRPPLDEEDCGATAMSMRTPLVELEKGQVGHYTLGNRDKISKNAHDQKSPKNPYNPNNLNDPNNQNNHNNQNNLSNQGKYKEITIMYVEIPQLGIALLLVLLVLIPSNLVIGVVYLLPKTGRRGGEKK